MQTKFLPAEASEIAWLLIGAMMGILFALDGYSGSKKAGEVARSYRFRNLKYALMTAFLSFIAELSKLGITADKGRLLMCYAEGFLGMAFALIGAMTVVIYFQSRSLLKQHPDILRLAGGQPALDYVFYGYNHHSTKWQ